MADDKEMEKAPSTPLDLVTLAWRVVVLEADVRHQQAYIKDLVAKGQGAVPQVVRFNALQLACSFVKSGSEADAVRAAKAFLAFLEGRSDGAATG